MYRRHQSPIQRCLNENADVKADLDKQRQLAFNEPSLLVCNNCAADVERFLATIR
jgi:hypothetical protein